MRKTRNWITLGCCFFALVIFAWAQAHRKPGLWEITMTTSMAGMQMPQMPQLPPGVTLPAGVTMPTQGPGGFTTTMQVCLTQAMIDKYGGASPASPNKNVNCKTTDISIQPGGMTAKISCTGQMTATGTVEAIFVDDSTTKTKMHMVGTMQHGTSSMPLDMTMLSTSVYKGADCGSVKPLPMPNN